MAPSPRAPAFLGLILAGAAMLAAASGGHALGQNAAAWPVRGKLIGKPDNNNPGDFKKAKDLSGIACDQPEGFPRRCVVIDDETQGAQLVILNDGGLAAGGAIPLLQDAFGGRPIEADGEGVAFADGYFYVIGSHGHPRDKDHQLDPIGDAAEIAAKIGASSRLFRIRIDPATVTAEGALTAPPEVTPSVELKKFLKAEPALAPFIDRRLDEDGLTVEGVAIIAGRLFAGIRSPLLEDEQAAVFSVVLDSLFSGAAPDPRLSLLGLGPGRGVRDLTADGANLLVLAGPSLSEDVPYAIFRWDGSAAPSLLAELPGFPGDDGELLKPEAILPLDRGGQGLRVLILFDGAVAGAPRAMRIAE